MALTAAAIDTPSRECETQSGYFWYICNWTTPDYSGCCRVDPCRQEPIGCPPSARGQTAPPTDDATTTTLTTTVPATETTVTVTRTRPTSTSHHPTSTSHHPTSSSSSTPAPGAGAPTSPTIASTSIADNDAHNRDGVALSVNALVGVVIGCSVVVVLAAVCAYMWWRRRRRNEDAKKKQGDRLTTSRGLGDEQIPSGMESFFNPMAQSGPGSVFDRDQGRMGKVDSMLGFSPLAHDAQSNRLSRGARSSLVSPLSPDSLWVSGLPSPSSPSELDSTSVHGSSSMAMSAQRNGTASAGSRQAGEDEGEGIPRATLNPTQEERETGTYANSWTRFQNVQL